MPISSGYKIFPVSRRYSTKSDLAQDQLADEVAVSLVYNGLSHAVMMTSPTALEDFALGFSLSEKIIRHPGQLYDVKLVQHPLGIELHIDIASESFVRLKEHRRNMTGRTGCGLCGAESLNQAIKDPETVDRIELPTYQAIEHALEQLKLNQPLQTMTGSVHCAALCDSKGQILLIREDVGRHNALDKLIGARTKRRKALPANSESFVLISSRASYEMVSKCASTGTSTLVAVSAPTALAVENAETAGMNLIGFARTGRQVIYNTGLSNTTKQSKQQNTGEHKPCPSMNRIA